MGSTPTEPYDLKVAEKFLRPCPAHGQKYYAECPCTPLAGGMYRAVIMDLVGEIRRQRAQYDELVRETGVLRATIQSLRRKVAIFRSHFRQTTQLNSMLNGELQKIDDETKEVKKTC